MQVQTVSATPRDCVVVFRVPDLPGHKMAIVMHGAIHNVQPDDWYRTGPLSFTEASKRAAHYDRRCEAFVLPATRYVLDRWMEVPLPADASERLYRRPTPRPNLIRLVRSRNNPN